jgi:hypothetical protein
MHDDERTHTMIDPASAADWVQASLVAGLLASLAAGGMWALGLEQRQALTRAARR